MTSQVIQHYPNCTADYPEKVPGEAPQSTTDVEISDTEIARSCNDCGAFVIVKQSDKLVLGTGSL